MQPHFLRHFFRTKASACRALSRLFIAGRNFRASDAVKRIPHQRMPDLRHVDPDLVRPAVLDPALQERSRLAVRTGHPRQYFVESPRRFSVRGAHHVVGARRLSPDRSVHDAFFLCKIPLSQSKVYFDEPSVFPLSLDHCRRFRISGKSHNARSLPVQPAGHPHIHRGAGPAQMGRRLIGQCVAVVAGRRMADHSRRLVDDQKVFVLVEDFERMRRQLRGGRLPDLAGFSSLRIPSKHLFRQPDSQDFALAQHMADIDFLAADPDAFFLKFESADLVSRKGKLLLQELPDALSGCLFLDRIFQFPAHRRCSPPGTSFESGASSGFCSSSLRIILRQ